jgi:hypothetical protein
MPEYEYYEPEGMQSMIGALEMASRVLRLSDRRPDLGVLMFTKIVELAGVCEVAAERFRAAALASVRH